MSKPGGDKPDELEGTEAPFVSHLIELRDRLIRAVLAIGVAFALLAFWPGPSGLYDLLAAPLVAHLPKGATLIATNVISPILVPLKITLMAAFMLALPVVLYQVWAFVAPGLYSHEKKMVLPLVGRLARGYNAARFGGTLAMLAGAGVPILKALQAAAETLGNRAMRSDALDALVQVREGAPLASALAGVVSPAHSTSCSPSSSSSRWLALAKA